MIRAKVPLWTWISLRGKGHDYPEWLCDFVDGVFLPGTTCEVCGQGSGACFDANGTPGCEDETCCLAVCIQDTFCCTTEWDQACADIAAVTCTPAPAPAASRRVPCVWAAVFVNVLTRLVSGGLPVM